MQAEVRAERRTSFYIKMIVLAAVVCALILATSAALTAIAIHHLGTGGDEAQRGGQYSLWAVDHACLIRQLRAPYS